MPKIRRSGIPEAVMRHLLVRAKERRIGTRELGEMADWFATDPEVPRGRWFRRFSSFTLCGEGELPKTFLLPGQNPDGQEVF